VSGPEPPVAGPACTHDLLRLSAERYGEFDAYVEADGTRLTFAEWDSAADGTAVGLAELGVGVGDVVSLYLPSSIDYAVCYLAAMRLGAITSGINPRLGPREVASILRRTDPAVVIDDGTLPVETDGLHIVHRSALAAMRTLGPLRHGEVHDPDLPLAVISTSGTTGDPKGAIYDHRNLEAVSIGAGPLRGPFDRRVSPNPFSHVGYMTHVFEEIGYVITDLLPPHPWKAGDVLTQMGRERATVGQGVPTQWRLILDHPDFDATDLSSLRICGTGAMPVPPALVREMQERLHCPVVIGYTSTETALTAGTVPGDTPERISSTVGRARENVELRIVDDEGVPVGIGVVGNVQCRSAARMRGYWRDPERTAAVLSPDGWLTTGDKGSVDADGYVTLSGRKSEMYMRGAYNIYPVEVERIVSEHPAVAQVAVVGRPDPVLGEIGVAFVVPVAGMTVTRDEVRAWTRGAIADYKSPDLVTLVDALPLTSMGKIDKLALAQRAKELPDPRH
jgi:acyl-CoA synthetase (AMP-forming)/AMP-acid ligase II